MMNNALISVVVPVYNIGDYLDKCLASLEGQSYSDIEIVAVDDGSTDGSRAVIERHAASDARIKTVFKANGGVSMARRDGVEASSGEYVMFVDGDDFIDSECVARLAGMIDKGADIAFSRIIRVTKEYCSPLPRRVGAETDGPGFLRHLLKHDIFSGISGVIYRRELLSGVCFYPDVPLWEDFLVNLQIALGLETGRVAFVDDAFYYYIQRPGSGNKRGVTFDYLQFFSRKVADTLAMRPGIESQFADEILTDRIHWYMIYISKSRNLWIGDTPFAITLYNDVMASRKELVAAGVAPSVISTIRMYRYKSLRPLWRASAVLRKWRTSLNRRLTGMSR